MRERQLDLFASGGDADEPDARTHAEYRKGMGLSCPVCCVAPVVRCKRSRPSAHPKQFIIDPADEYFAVLADEERAAQGRSIRKLKRERRASTPLRISTISEAAALPRIVQLNVNSSKAMISPMIATRRETAKAV